MMKNKLIVIGALGSVLALSSGAQAATISWGSATDITGDTDVSTVGSTHVAANFDRGAASVVVNGVTFTGGGSQGNMNSSATYGTLLDYTFTGGSPTAFNAAGGTFQTLSTDYQNILNGASWADVGSNNITLGDLVNGQEYQVQIWMNDPRAAGATNTMLIDGTVSLNYQVGATTGNAGQFVTGTFTADATTQVLTLDSEADGWQINALQVRAVPEPSSSAMLLGGLGMLVMRRRRN